MGPTCKKKAGMCEGNTLATWCEELTHWKRPWCWERLRAGGEGDNRGWDGWMASLTRWTWVWVDSRSWLPTGRPGVLPVMVSQRVGHDWATVWTKLMCEGRARQETQVADSTSHYNLGSAEIVTIQSSWHTPVDIHRRPAPPSQLWGSRSKNFDLSLDPM